MRCLEAAVTAWLAATRQTSWESVTARTQIDPATLIASSNSSPVR